jgi:dienelactone hydrolase
MRTALPPATPRLAVCTAALLALSGAIAAQGDGWRANPQVVERTAKQQTAFNYDETRVPPYTLPDPLTVNGRTVRTRDAWPEARRAILELFREHVYGRSPGKPQHLRFEVVEENPGAMDGAATLKRMAVISEQAGRSHRFEITLFLPNARREPAPVFLLLNNRPATNADPSRRERSGFWPAEQLIARGYGIAALQVSDLAPDDKDRFRDGAIRLFEGSTPEPRARNAWAALAAWAWGASRAMDYFETDRRVDATKVAVVGHSRGGKAALWAGAEDERFAITIANESGEGGAALSRRVFGETLARITSSFPHWFADRYKDFATRVDALPIDQHMLLGLIAPRAVYVASADEDLWADPRGEFLAQVHASPVYALWGEPPMRADDMPPLNRPLIAGKRGYHVRDGVHNLTPYDWDRFADFADGLWKNHR